LKNETHISTEPHQAGSNARVFKKDVHQERQESHKQATSQGAQAAGGLNRLAVVLF